MREVAAEFERPVLLFSGGKDSIVMLRLAEKAFWPAPIPFPVMHVDTGHNFPEVLAFRDRRVAELGVQPDRRRRSEDASTSGLVREEPADGIAQPDPDPGAARRGGEVPLRRAVRRRPPRRGEGPGQGAGVLLPRRVRPVGPEEPAPRAVVAVQRPHPRRARRSGSSRCPTGPSWTSGSTSPASSIELPAIYFAHEREVVDRDGMLLRGQRVPAAARRREVVRRARCATAPSATRAAPRRCGPTPTPSRRSIDEVAATRITERGATRGDDRVSEAAMEDRKSEGYF